MKLKRRNLEEDHRRRWNNNLDNFLLRLTKTVGVVAVIIGFAIIIAFWIWVIKMLYKVGA